MDKDKFCRLIAKEISKQNVKDYKHFLKLRQELCRRYKPKIFPSLIQVLTYCNDYEALNFLKTKPTRTIAGVTPIAIMSKPYNCPHGRCIMCPGGIGSHFGTTPQSYTGYEPAALRAKRNYYDPFLQTFNRLEQYTLLKQSTDKVELIIMGGTFIALNPLYVNNFVKFALKAMNDFSEMFYRPKFKFNKFKEFFELPAYVKDDKRTRRLKKKILGLKHKTTLETEKLRNEKSKVRCVAMCIETRPDYCKQVHINKMLDLGCTRVELGVQTIYNKILNKIERGHSVKDSVTATQLLRDSFLKVGYHIMPGLPGSTYDLDLNMFKELFTNPDYKPDMLKVYPCTVIKGTKLYDLYKRKQFKPLTSEDAIKLIIEAKKFIAPYCRVMRVQRDIPSKLIEAGVNVTNLRQEISKIMEQRKIKCNCIRCREPKGKLAKPKLHKIEYEASNGTEIFISLVDSKNTIYGFCRLRQPYKPFRKEITARSMGVRQLHVYSESVKIGQKPNKNQAQHRGFGRILMEEAEKIAREEFDAKQLLVLPGIGVKEYFRKKLGYRDISPVYLSKTLS